MLVVATTFVTGARLKGDRGTAAALSLQPTGNPRHAELPSQHPAPGHGDPCKCPHPAGHGACNKTRTASPLTPAMLWSGPASAADKLEATWQAIIADPASHGFMNPLKTLIKAADPSYLAAMEGANNGTWDVQREAGHEKITHGVAGHAKAHIRWRANPYSGMFQSAEHCVIRIANAAAPSTSWLNPTAYNPNMAIKCFRDGKATELDDLRQSANLQLIWEIDGYNVIPEGLTKSCSYFETPLSNHCGRRANISMTLKDTFIQDFDKVSGQSLMLGVSQMAQAEENGTSVEVPSFPFALVFVPNPKLNSVPCDFKDVTRQLKNLDQAGGEPIYEIYAVHDPWYSRPAGSPSLSHIGSLVLDSSFVTSAWGDTELFFRHTFWEKERALVWQHNASRAEQWDLYADQHRQHEGAAWYWPFIHSASA